MGGLSRRDASLSPLPYRRRVVLQQIASFSISARPLRRQTTSSGADLELAVLARPVSVGSQRFDTTRWQNSALIRRRYW
jgi:hypothetical protein